jgi:hypothetical protein
MKNKRLLLFAAIVTCWGSISAQVTQSYDFTNAGSTYTEMTGGTAIPSSGTGDAFHGKVIDGAGTAHDAAFTGQGYPIGFDFKYDNKKMNQFMVSTDGYIVLGKDEVKADVPSNAYFIFSSDNDADVLGVISIGSTFGIDKTQISYKTTGESPNRVLTIQYKDLAIATRWGDEAADTVQLQYNLYEATGNIEFHFNGWQPDPNVSLSYMSLKAGIKGSTAADHLMAASFTESKSSLDESMLSWSSTSYPADGRVFTFTPPEDCIAPSTQPEGLKLTSSSTAVNGSFTKTTAADHYLVLLNKSKDLTVLPEDNKMYATGDSIGDARVLDYETNDTIKSGDILEGATTYYVHVLSVNSFCMFGPKYNTTNPLALSIATLANAPSSLSITSTDLSSMTLKTASNDKGNNVIIGKTTIAKMSNYGDITVNGAFGQPAGELNVGDSIIGGGYVIYKGKASDAIKVDGLSGNTLYHYAAWSMDDSGNYSSTYINANGITASMEPWTPDFSKMAIYEAPTGWNKNGEWRIESDYALSETVKKDASNGSVSWVETPDIYLSEGTNRIIYGLLMTEYVSWSNNPYVFNDNDTIAVQVTTDGVNYKTINTLTKKNAPNFNDTKTYLKYYVPFTDCAGKKARLRFWCKIFGGPKISINDLRVEHKGDCDYPINVSTIDSTVIGDKAAIKWTSQSDEDAWDIRYKKSSDAEWGTATTIRTNPYTMSGLDGLTNYDVQVRARCSTTSQSEWSDSYTFKSGMLVPFEEIFKDEASAPNGWLFETGKIGTPTTLEDGGDWSFFSMRSNKYMQIRCYDDSTYSWLITPKFDLGDGSVNYIANFDLTTSTVSKATNAKVQLVVARDGAKFDASDVVLTIPVSDMPARNKSKEYKASLKGYTGSVRLALYVSASDGIGPRLLVDSLGVQYSCVNDVTDFQIDSIGETAAKVKWTSSADKWLVFCRKQGEKTKTYQEVSTPAFKMTGLKSHTTYELGITKSCEPGDTAAVKIFEVTTIGTGCDTPTDIKVIPSKYSATISWTSEASGFNVKYRKSGDATWLKETVTGNTIKIADLFNDTEYEYAIQSRCSKAEQDTSEYSSIAKFTTVKETCFAPTNINIVPTYKSADVTWQGESDNYQIAYRKTKTSDWTVMTAQEGKATISGLDAETAYDLRMRSICAPGDTSLWSAIVNFMTTAIPACVTPSDLTVKEITANSAQLSWTADASNLTWNLRYRKSNVTSWTEQTDLKATVYSLAGLESNTVYIWRVQATCEEERVSNWAAQNKFTTSVASGIDGIAANDINVFAKGKMLNVINPDGAEIKSIQVFNTNGQLMEALEVNSTENVFVRLDTAGNIIVKVNCLNHSKTAHVNIK